MYWRKGGTRNCGVRKRNFVKFCKYLPWFRLKVNTLRWIEMYDYFENRQWEWIIIILTILIACVFNYDIVFFMFLEVTKTLLNSQQEEIYTSCLTTTPYIWVMPSIPDSLPTRIGIIICMYVPAIMLLLMDLWPYIICGSLSLSWVLISNIHVDSIPIPASS